MNKNQIKNRIAYFRSCYAADNRSLQLYSFFSKKITYTKVLDDSDLLSGALSYLPMEEEWGEKSIKTLSLYSKEKSLYFCAFFVCGNTVILNRKQRLIAPLLLYPAELKKEDGMYQVELQSFTPLLNPAAIQILSVRDESLNAIDELSDQIPTGPFRFQEAVFLKNTLDHLYSNLNTDLLAKYPEIVNAKDLEKYRKSKTIFKEDDQFHLIPGMGLGILSKTKSGRGILNELKELSSEKQELSDPLISLIKQREQGQSRWLRENVFVPVTLNKAQENLIKVSHDKEISIAIGPPGTGKSFTIAALTIDAISRGESVLIASNNQQAVEVIAQKLKNDFLLDHEPIKTTDKKWKAQAKQYLENILAGIGIEDRSRNDLQKLERHLNISLSKINRLERIIESRTENEKKWGRYLFMPSPSLWEKWRLSRFKRRSKRVEPLWVLYRDLLEELHYKNELLHQYISMSREYFLFKTLSRRRKELQFFLKALRARTGNLKEERFNKVNFNSLLNALPVWLVTMEEISQVLPLRKELFDLVIFDESTQCNISSALPVIQRGKRLVIVGDPKQLRHISFLSRKRQLQLLEQHQIPEEDIEELDYRNKSLLDFALDQMTQQDNIHFLNEHYRSLPDLIDFSNRKFYNKALNIMTDTPTAKVTGNLFLHKVKGKRSRTGYNEKEASLILQKINELIEEEARLDAHLCKTIGILSPFREHTDYLSQIVEKKLSYEAIRRHNILIGTPHFFQGEERDIMFLSFALDESSHPSAFQYLEKPDVFNVSITRARSEQHLLISFTPGMLRSGSLLKEYLASVSLENQGATDSKGNTAYDEFMIEIVDVLKAIPDVQLHINYHISGLDIDIVAIIGGKTFGIDLVGYPGNYVSAFPLERIKMLDRMDIKVFSMPFLIWTLERERCIQALLKFLEIPK